MFSTDLQKLFVTDSEGLFYWPELLCLGDLFTLLWLCYAYIHFRIFIYCA